MKGWYPYTAKNFLSEQGLETRYYINHANDDEWFAISNPKPINSDPILLNTTTYKVVGDANIVKRLELNLFVRDLTEREQSLEAFCLDVLTLYKLSIGQEISKQIILKIMDNSAFSYNVNEHHFIAYTSDLLVSPGFYSKFVIGIV